MSRIVFRLDFGSMMGTGHLMRCFALARELVKRNHEATFIYRNLGLSDDVLKDAPGALIRLDTSSGGPFTQLDDFTETRSKVRQRHEQAFDLMIADHYGIGTIWEEASRSIAKKVMAIDDLANRDHAVDILLDQNFYSDFQTRYVGRVSSNTTLLLGPEFAIIRPEFRDGVGWSWKPRKSIESILVCFGGSDFLGAACAVAELLLHRTGYAVVVLGKSRPEDASRWNELSERFSGRLSGPVFSHHPLNFFLQSDIFIGSGGSITWERYAVGLPGIVYSVAENQEKVAEDCASAGFHSYLGKWEAFQEAALLSELRRYEDSEFHAAIATKTKTLVDGKGIERIVDALEQIIL